MSKAKWTWGSTQYQHDQAQQHCIHKHKQKGMKKPQFVSLSSLWMTSPLTIREPCGLIWFSHPILDGFYQLRPPRFYLPQNPHLHLSFIFHLLHLHLIPPCTFTLDSVHPTSQIWQVSFLPPFSDVNTCLWLGRPTQIQLCAMSTPLHPTDYPVPSIPYLVVVLSPHTLYFAE